MQAITLKRYGEPQAVLSLSEMPTPIPKDDEVLIQVVATAINDYDWGLVRGRPYLYQLLFGLFTPKHRIPGMELSGIVIKTGSNVRKFKKGDAVYGDISEYGFGTFSEYLAVHEEAVIAKPKNLSFLQAAALPHAATLAWQGLKDLGDIKQGQRILINGGGGGVGTIGVQLAKLYDCEVTGVDSANKLEFMKSIGYDHVVDYRKVDFTKTDKQYDLILDCKTNRSPWAYLRALKEGGRYVTVGGQLGQLVNLLVVGKLISLFSKKKLSILALKANKGLDQIADLCLLHQINSRIDGPHPIQDIPQLVQYFGEGRHFGKVVVEVGSQ